MQSEASILKQAREKLGLTQQQVANKAGIQLRQYQRFENAERNLTSSSFNIGCSVLEALEIDIAGFRRGDYVLSKGFDTMTDVIEYSKNNTQVVQE
jgi:transcriptional regulator with XRE-family HTH domain